MGTGTPTVTTSGIAAANAVLSKRGLKPFVYDSSRKEYVHLIQAPFTCEQLYASVEPEQRNSTRSEALPVVRASYLQPASCASILPAAKESIWM